MVGIRIADFNQAVQSGWKNLDSGESWTHEYTYPTNGRKFTGDPVADTDTTTTARTRAKGTARPRLTLLNSVTSTANQTSYNVANAAYNTGYAYVLVAVNSRGSADPDIPTPSRTNLAFNQVSTVVAGTGTDRYRITVWTFKASSNITSNTINLATTNASSSMVAASFLAQGAATTGTNCSDAIRNVVTAVNAASPSGGTVSGTLTLTNPDLSQAFAVGVNNTSTIYSPTISSGSFSSLLTGTVATPNTSVGMVATAYETDLSLSSSQTVSLTGWTATTVAGLLSFELVSAYDSSASYADGPVYAKHIAGTQTDKNVELTVSGRSYLNSDITTTDIWAQGLFCRKIATDTYIAVLNSIGYSGGKGYQYELDAYTVVSNVWTQIGTATLSGYYQNLRLVVYDDTVNSKLIVRARTWTTTEGSTWDLDISTSTGWSTFGGQSGTSGIIDQFGYVGFSTNSFSGTGDLYTVKSGNDAYFKQDNFTATSLSTIFLSGLQVNVQGSGTSGTNPPTVGAQDLTPSGLQVNVQGSGTSGTNPPVVGAQDISPSGYSLSVGYGAPTVAAGEYSLSVSGLSVAVGYGSPDVTGVAGQPISVSGLSVAVGYGSVTLASSVAISVSGLSVAVGYGSVTVAQQVSLSVQDTVGIVDAYSTPNSFTRGVNDVVGIVDDLPVSKHQTVSVSDVVGIVDSFLETGSSIQQLLEVVGLTDSVSVQVHTVRVAADTVGVSDQTLVVDLHEVVDQVGVSDNVVVAIITQRAVADTVGTSDTVRSGFAKRVTIVDPVGVSDARTQVHLSDVVRQIPVQSILFEEPKQKIDAYLTLQTIIFADLVQVIILE